MIENGEALCELGVFCSRNREIRLVTTRSPVMQVMSTGTTPGPRCTSGSWTAPWGQ